MFGSRGIAPRPGAACDSGGEIVEKGGSRLVGRSTGFGHDLGTEGQPPRATILLVEDDAAIAFMLTDVLESTGYAVTVAGTGAAARTQVEQHTPDLVILDLVLPDEDGLVLCSVLKNMASVPILPGCVSQGDNRAEALSNIREAIELYIEDCRDAGDPVPTEAGKEFVEIEAA